MAGQRGDHAQPGRRPLGLVVDLTGTELHLKSTVDTALSTLAARHAPSPALCHSPAATVYGGRSTGARCESSR